MPKPLFDKCGGYRKMHSFTFATLIHLETISFCKRFIPWQEDQLGKTSAQMIGAARSGRQNIIEGSERSSTSKETEIKLIDVARASLAELLGDYEVFLGDSEVIPWSRNDPEYRKIAATQLPDYHNNDDQMHEYWKYYHENKKAFAPWFRSDEPAVVANAMLILIQRTMAMLSSQLRYLGETFLNEGGFRERMYQCRTDARDEKTQTEENAPECPECGRPMRKRNAQKGNKAGNLFWGCTAFPECRGTREIEN